MTFPEIIVNRDSKLVRWAYMLEGLPAQTSLCVLFWRAALLSPAIVCCAVALLAIVGVAAAALGFLVVSGVLVVLVTLGTSGVCPVLAVFGACLLIVDHIAYWRGHDIADFVRQFIDAPMAQGVLAMKRGVCPIVKIR